MKKLFQAYRVLAYVVGVLLALLALVGMPLKYLTAEESGIQQFGSGLTLAVAIGHGWIYLVYLVVAYLLSRAAKWDLKYLLVMVAAGLVPLSIFWVERRVTARLIAEHPELAS